MQLQAEERERLIRYLNFLQTEVSDFEKFRRTDWKTYQKDRDIRRNLERWIENLVNCAIDISKVLLVAENLPIPQTYREILRQLGATSCFDESFGNEISQWASLRNIITHDYLDIHWTSIRRFLEGAERTWKSLAEKIDRILRE